MTIDVIKSATHGMAVVQKQSSKQVTVKADTSSKGYLHFVKSFLLYEIVPENNGIWSVVEYTFLLSVTSLKPQDCNTAIPARKENFLQTTSETSRAWTEHSHLNAGRSEYSE